MDAHTQAAIKKELKTDAHALNIPTGSADIFIDKSIQSALTSLQHKSIITDTTLRRAIIKELKKYHTDLAYVYENRDKIV